MTGKVSKKTWDEHYGEQTGIPAARRALQALQKTCKKGRTGMVVRC